jgi:hypothetical protein
MKENAATREEAKEKSQPRRDEKGRGKEKPYQAV